MGKDYICQEIFCNMDWIEVNDLEEISMDYGDDLSISDKSCDFSREKGWVVYERNYLGTRWYEAGGPGKSELEIIKEYLGPIAKLLGIEVSDDLAYRNNPRSLLDAKAEFLEEREMEEIEGSKRKIGARIYQLPNGEKVCLKEFSMGKNRYFL